MRMEELACITNKIYVTKNTIVIFIYVFILPCHLDSKQCEIRLETFSNI